MHLYDSLLKAAVPCPNFPALGAWYTHTEDTTSPTSRVVHLSQNSWQLRKSKCPTLAFGMHLDKGEICWRLPKLFANISVGKSQLYIFIRLSRYLSSNPSWWYSMIINIHVFPAYAPSNIMAKQKSKLELLQDLPVQHSSTSFDNITKDPQWSTLCHLDLMPVYSCLLLSTWYKGLKFLLLLSWLLMVTLES